MALQIRRGTNADRLTITPDIGELIYTTDSKQVYVGDGVTLGGTNISQGISSLLEDTSPQLGASLDLNGQNIVGTGNINIDGTITATGNINLGDDTGDNISVGGRISTALIPANDSLQDLGSNSNRWNNGWLTGLNVDGQIDAVAINANLVADDSTVVFDASTGKIDAAAIEGTLTNVAVTGDLVGSVFSDNSVLMVDAINQDFYGRLVGNVLGDAVGDHGGTFTGELINVSVTGPLRASLIGDTIGSVFSQDSTQLVDGMAGTLTGPFDGYLRITEDTISNKIYSSTTNIGLEFRKLSGDLDNPSEPANFARVGITFGSYNNGASDFVTESIINSYHQTAGGGYIALTPVSQDNSTFFETALELDGNAQTMVVAAPKGTTFNGAIKPGTYADETARDAAITSPTAGMIIFLAGHDDSSGDPKFQGYDGNKWVDLN